MAKFTHDHVHLRSPDPEATAQFYERMFDAAVAELKAKGAEFTMEPTTIRPNVRIAFLRGPQGVSIELVDRNAA
jgi:catechol 2,3-dioxygenase-like lactoylglutathione lyase family enzyme